MSLTLSKCIFLNNSLLKYATKDSTLADGVDSSQAPEKDLVEKEKAALKKLLPLVEKFVHEKVDLQVSWVAFLSMPCCWSLLFPLLLPCPPIPWLPFRSQLLPLIPLLFLFSLLVTSLIHYPSINVYSGQSFYLPWACFTSSTTLSGFFLFLIFQIISCHQTVSSSCVYWSILAFIPYSGQRALCTSSVLSQP